MNEDKVLIGWRTFMFPRIFGMSIFDTKVAVRVLSGWRTLLSKGWFYTRGKLSKMRLSLVSAWSAFENKRHVEVFTCHKQRKRLSAKRRTFSGSFSRDCYPLLCNALSADCWSHAPPNPPTGITDITIIILTHILPDKLASWQTVHRAEQRLLQGRLRGCTAQSSSQSDTILSH